MPRASKQGQLPPVTARTNLATVTYPVTIASRSQKQVTENDTEMLYKVQDNAKETIEQFSILLTRKGTHLKHGGKHLPVFSRVNKIKGGAGATKQQMRQKLMNELKFAGIAFTGAEEGNGDGTPSMLASVIGGSHTVMSYRSDYYKEKEPLRAGTVVRWTLPEFNDGIDTAYTDAPVKFHGASSNGVFALLEAVEPGTTAAQIHAQMQYDMDEDRRVNPGNPTVPLPLPQEMIERVLKYNAMLQEREIGTVIQDNGNGSIDIRLK